MWFLPSKKLSGLAQDIYDSMTCCSPAFRSVLSIFMRSYLSKVQIFINPYKIIGIGKENKILRNTNNKVIIKDYWYASNGWKHMIRNSAHVNTCMYSLFLVRHLTRPLQSEGQQAHPHPEVFWGALSRSQPNPFLWCPPGATLRIHCALLLVCNSSTCI